MKTGIKRDINNTYLIMEHPTPYEPDYQLNMLRANQLQGILPISGRGVDDSSQYHYEISGKVSMKAMYEKAKIEQEDIKRFMNQLLGTLHQLRMYMLDVNRLILEPDYIFYEDGDFYFCYFPPQEYSLCQVFHTLTEYFVSRVDYEDKNGIYLAYELHKVTMEENYNLEQVNDRIINQVIKEKEPVIGQSKYDKFYSENDWEEKEVEEKEVLEYREEDWSTTFNMGIRAVREKADEWKPFKSIKEIMKHKSQKKSKGSEWEDL